jgi:cytochrome c5
MMLALVISVAVQAAPMSPRVLYEEKCLFCHSEEVTEEKHFTAAQWRREVNKMRAKAPLLITRHDADVLVEYIVKQLKLVPATPAPKPTAPKPTAATPPPAVEAPPLAPQPPPPVPPPPPPEEPLRPAPETLDEPPPQPPLPPEAQAAADLLDEEGAALMQRRCSKCHTLQRVFGKLDSYEKSVFTLKRMRLKMGSGISRNDEERMQQFLRSQFNVP